MRLPFDRGAFLDIGTGTGWLAIEAVRRWRGFTATGIDRWEPALALARRNVASEGMDAYLTTRTESLEDLSDRGRYDLVWLPGPFFLQPVADASLPAARNALVPGGTLVFGFLAPLAAGLTGSIAMLQVVRSGGHPWTCSEVETLLATSGFVDVEILEGAPLMLAAGRSPAATTLA